MSTTALIEARGLNRFYGKHHAVKDFNLTLHKGEVLGLLGPNGAGKSSTMQMLTGNISPSSGDITIHGVNLLEEPLRAKQSIGYLPEQPPLYRDMTPLEFLSYCAVLHDIPQGQIQAALERVIDRCGLETVTHKLIANLSKGFQQRVGIAQAILHQPDVVILDEPTVGLDPIQITQIRQLIRELGNDHSVILSTHILPEVQAVCDRVQIINAGNTVFADSFEELAEKQVATQLMVGFKQEVDTDKLALLKDVIQVETVLRGTDRSRYRLIYQNQPDPEKVYQLAQQENWRLTELTPEVVTLEQIFMSLIHHDGVDQAYTALQASAKSIKNGGGVS